MTTQECGACCDCYNDSHSSESRGILYFIRGTAFIERFAVSIFSLRRFWSGNISVIIEGTEATAIEDFCRRMQVNFIKIGDTGRPAYAAKISALYRSPYKITLFLDADTIINSNIAPLFDAIGDKDFVFTSHQNLTCREGKGKWRLNAWRAHNLVDELILNKAFEYPFINIGVFVYRAPCLFLSTWLELSTRGEELELGISDEVCAQVFLSELNHIIVGEEWNYSALHGSLDFKYKILHFHGTSHVGNHPFINVFRKMLDDLADALPDQFCDFLTFPKQVLPPNPEIVHDIFKKTETKKPWLIYTIAFDAPGQNAFRTMAKMLVSSCLRTKFPGDIIVFKNFSSPLFVLGRAHLTEICIDTEMYSGAERTLAASCFKYLASNFINLEKYERILFLDCDCLVLGDLSEAFADVNSLLFSEERSRITQSQFSNLLSEEEMKTLKRNGVNSGVWLIDADKLNFLAGKWENSDKFRQNNSKQHLIDDQVTDQPAFNRCVIDWPYSGSPFSEGFVQYPGMSDGCFSRWPTAKVLHFCGFGMTTSNKIETMFGVWCKVFMGDGASTLLEIFEP